MSRRNMQKSYEEKKKRARSRTTNDVVGDELYKQKTGEEKAKRDKKYKAYQNLILKYYHDGMSVDEIYKRFRLIMIKAFKIDPRRLIEKLTGETISSPTSQQLNKEQTGQKVEPEDR